MGCFFETGLSLWPFFNFDNERCQVFFQKLRGKKRLSSFFLSIYLSFLAFVKKKTHQKKKRGTTFSKFFNIFSQLKLWHWYRTRGFGFCLKSKARGCYSVLLGSKASQPKIYDVFCIYSWELEKYYFYNPHILCLVWFGWAARLNRVTW